MFRQVFRAEFFRNLIEIAGRKNGGRSPLSKTGAEMLFKVFSQRYERGSTLVTSNLPFAEWPRRWDRSG
jgi:hypothetical protein